jgi:hypothetical protein
LRGLKEINKAADLVLAVDEKARNFMDIEATHYTQLISYRQPTMISPSQSVQLYTRSVHPSYRSAASTSPVVFTTPTIVYVVPLM